MLALERALDAFLRTWGAERRPRLFRAPGRVNLIGEHTDYNQGFVLPVAIDRDVVMAAAPQSGRVDVMAADLGSRQGFSLPDEATLGGPHWLRYIRGVAWALAGSGERITGLYGAVAGDVPRGAGLGSSAALEVATGYALLSLSGAEVRPTALALAAQRAENEYVGLRCGIMDQLTSCLAREGHALLIDCRSLSCRPVRLPPDLDILVVDSGIRRSLLASEYNVRLSQCSEAAARLGVPSLRDADERMLSSHGELPLPLLRRARHVVTENARTLSAAQALEAGDFRAVGRLMDASHASLRDDFEVSTPALDRLVAIARRVDGVYGARLTGAGFGGCVIALAQPGVMPEVERLVGREYAPAGGAAALVYTCRAAAGAGEATSPPGA